MLHMTKVAVGCPDLPALKRRVEARATDGEVQVDTRFRPTRADEVVGGSLYWIVKHRLVARQRVLRFQDGGDGRQRIVVEDRLVPVRPKPKRAHQGWRYLPAADAPADFEGDDDGVAALPPRLLLKLSALALV